MGTSKGLAYRVSADTTQARGDIERLASTIKGLGGDVQGSIESQATALDSAIKTMERAGNSPAALQKAAGLAAFQLEKLAKDLEAAGVVGNKVPEELAAKMEVAGKAIGAAAEKSAAMKEAISDTAAAGAMAGDRFDTLRARTSSVEAVFENMRKTGDGAWKSLGSIAAGAGIAGAAFAVGEAAGTKFAEALVKVVDKTASVTDVLQKFEERQVLVAAALKAVNDGHIKLGANLDETLARYKEYAASTGRAASLTEEFANKVRDIKPAENLSSLKKQVEEFAVAMQGVNKKSWEELQVRGEDFAKTADTIIEGYARLGKRAPEDLLRVRDALKAAADAQKLLAGEGARELIESYEKIHQKHVQAAEDAQKSIDDLTAEKDAAILSLNQQSLSQEEYASKRKEIEKAYNADFMSAIAARTAAQKEATAEEATFRADADLSAATFTALAAAAGLYEKEIKEGREPQEAMGDAIRRLEIDLDKSRAAIPNFGLALTNLADGALKPTQEEAGNTAKTLAAIQTALDPLQSATDAAATGLGVLAGNLAAVNNQGGLLLAGLPQLIAGLGKLAAAAASTANGGGGGTGEGPSPGIPEVPPANEGPG